MNHTISALLVGLALVTSVSFGTLFSGEPVQKAAATDGGCDTKNKDNTSICLFKRINISNNIMEVLFFQSTPSKNNDTLANKVMASQKDTPFILPFP
ncbi:MAG TPA: hypothetical protein VE619_08190 [Nitrososphaeraceae archaeon]|nr:hypothetical protein [Nitrososphaeraceae archaeon]